MISLNFILIFIPFYLHFLQVISSLVLLQTVSPLPLSVLWVKLILIALTIIFYPFIIQCFLLSLLLIILRFSQHFEQFEALLNIINLSQSNFFEFLIKFKQEKACQQLYPQSNLLFLQLFQSNYSAFPIIYQDQNSNSISIKHEFSTQALLFNPQYHSQEYPHYIFFSQVFILIPLYHPIKSTEASVFPPFSIFTDPRPALQQLTILLLLVLLHLKSCPIQVTVDVRARLNGIQILEQLSMLEILSRFEFQEMTYKHLNQQSSALVFFQSQIY